MQIELELAIKAIKIKYGISKKVIPLISIPLVAICIVILNIIFGLSIQDNKIFYKSVHCVGKLLRLDESESFLVDTIFHAKSKYCS